MDQLTYLVEIHFLSQLLNRYYYEQLKNNF
jgi:hypothetical protein